MRRVTPQANAPEPQIRGAHVSTARLTRCLVSKPSRLTFLVSLRLCCRFPGAFLFRRFNSLFGRFNSLLDRLGNFPFESCKMNDLRVQIRSANCPQVDFSQYFPVLQGTKAGHRPPPRRLPHPWIRAKTRAVPRPGSPPASIPPPQDIEAVTSTRARRTRLSEPQP